MLPNLLISDIRDALSAAQGLRIYVCNVATQPGETAAFSAAEHLEALFAHIGEGLIDYVLLNHNQDARRPEGWQGQPVVIDARRLEELPVVVVEEDLVDVTNAHRHDPAKLAAALMRLQQEDRVRASAAAPDHPAGARGLLIAAVNARCQRGEGRAGPDRACACLLPAR